MSYLEIAAAICGGGLGTELVRRIFANPDVKIQDGAQLRGELWQRLNVLESHVEALQHSVDEWQEKYYRLQSDHLILQREHEALSRKHQEMKVELERMKAQRV